jgi:two-component system, OmpR family, alkaline phosphatase synthesis response regulator PhoP
MAKKIILIIEDEKDIRTMLSYALNKEGYEVVEADNGAVGLRRVREYEISLVILDLMLPEIDGLEVCRRMKSDPKTAKIPIIMVTARGEESDVVAGLELGAEDYVVKPFSIKVLIARLRAVLRRKNSSVEDATISIGNLKIDSGKHKVTLKGRELELTLSEYGVLFLLAGKIGWVFTRGQIVDAIRGENYAVTERSVDVMVTGLRKKMGTEGRKIETVRGVGYRFKE